MIDAHLPSPGTPTQGVEAGYMANAYVRMRHPDYDVLRGLLDDAGRTIHVRPVRAPSTSPALVGRIWHESPAINQFQQQDLVDEAAVDGFSPPTTRPIVEGATARSSSGARPMRCISRSAFLACPVGCRWRLSATTLWYIVLKVPEGSRINYQLEVRRGEHVERFNDPQTPSTHSPFGASSVCFAHGYITPAWTFPDESDTRRAHRTHRGQPSIAARLSGDHLSAGDGSVTTSHFRCWWCTTVATSCSTPLRRSYSTISSIVEIADMVVAFLHPKDRLVEYANSAEHARFLTHELLPRSDAEFPCARPFRSRPAGRQLWCRRGTVGRLPIPTYGSLALMSGSFVVCRRGTDHGGGRVLTLW